MEESYDMHLVRLRLGMLLVNLLNVLFYASLVLLTTKYIVDNQMSRSFFESIPVLPRDPLVMFWGAILLYVALVSMMCYRDALKVESESANTFYSLLELVLCFLLMYFLYMGYNGIVMLVFCDCLRYFKLDSYSKWMLGAFVAVYAMANYDVCYAFIQMPSIQQYIQVHEGSVQGFLLLVQSLLSVVNTMLFISFVVRYIMLQIEEKESITMRLLKLRSVNRELKAYAAITEKIGENNERKRLAREIHDTVGHALAGVAAGVDACIVIMDVNPQGAKQQLRIISKVVRQGMSDVRSSLSKLRPGALEKNGFKVAVEKMVEEFAGVSNLDIRLRYLLGNVDFDTTKENVLFRIIQESITNAVRHGGAEKVFISLFQRNNILYLKIKDNGQGCGEIKYGFGLKQMQERVAIIGGRVSFDGHNGFLTVVELPLQKGEWKEND